MISSNFNTSFNVFISVSDIEDVTHGDGLESEQKHRNKVMKHVLCHNVPQIHLSLVDFVFFSPPSLDQC